MLFHGGARLAGRGPIDNVWETTQVGVFIARENALLNSIIWSFTHLKWPHPNVRLTLYVDKMYFIYNNLVVIQYSLPYILQNFFVQNVFSGNMKNDLGSAKPTFFSLSERTDL